MAGRVKDEDMLRELHRALQHLEIEVRLCDGASDGGLCRLGGRSVLFLNKMSSPSSQISVICRALQRKDLSNIFLLPALRQRLKQSEKSA